MNANMYRKTRVGLAAAVVVTFNPLAIYYAQEARAYSLLLLTSAVAFLGFAVWALIPDRFDEQPDMTEKTFAGVFWTTTAAFFLIDSGEATITKKGVNVATVGPGDYVGEVALIDGGPRSATVTAATDMVCYGLTFWEFRPLVERNGGIGWKLLQALAKRLRAADA